MGSSLVGLKPKSRQKPHAFRGLTSQGFTFLPADGLADPAYPFPIMIDNGSSSPVTLWTRLEGKGDNLR